MKIQKLAKNIYKWHIKTNQQNFYYRSFTFVAKMILQILFIVLTVLAITFFLTDLIPGDSGLLAGKDEFAQKAIIEKYGLDLPLVTRYFNYVSNFFKFDFGVSESIRPEFALNNFIWSRFSVSAQIGFISLLLSLLVGIPLGILIGRKPGKFLDMSSTFVLAILISIPTLILSLLFLILGRLIGLPYVFEKNNLVTYILPCVTMAVPQIVGWVRFIRVGINEQLNSMHYKFALLKGVSQNRFLWKHALRPAFFPIATFLPMAFLGTFIGGLFVEQVFQIPGSGFLFATSISTNDRPVLLFLISIFCFISIIGFKLRDFLYNILDPRIRRKK